MRRQSFGAFECLVVDDGSTDRTREIVREFERVDGRFRALASPGQGLIQGLNHGIAFARSPWIARMDADDLMHKRRLELQLAEVRRRPGLAGVGAHVRMFPRRALTNGRLKYEAWLNSIRSAADVYRERFVECPLAHPTWLVKRELLCRLSYRDIGAAEDYDLLLRLLSEGWELSVVPACLHLWRDHAGRASRCQSRYDQARFTWLKALHLSRTVLAERGSYTLWGYGATGKNLCHELQRRGHSPSHIVEVHPGRLGQRIQGASVVQPSALEHLRGQPLIVSVAGELARREIRQALASLGYSEPDDFVCAA